MSLDPVLARHYINAPKPIPTRTPARSRTSSCSQSHPSLYSRDHLLALSPSHPSPPPNNNLHQIPALLPASASKIDSVNRILRKDSADFLNSQAKAREEEVKGLEMRARSQTMPIPVLLHTLMRFPNELKEDGEGKRRNNTLVEMNPGTEIMEGEYDPAYGQKINNSLQGLGGYVDTPRSAGFNIESPMDMNMDFEGDINIELKSANRLPLSPAIPIPSPRSGSLTPRAASSIFNQQQQSANGKYTPASPSPLSLSLAQSMSKSHQVLRSANSPRAETKNVTIVSSPIDDLPWRRPSLVNSSSSSPSPSTPSPRRPSHSAIAIGSNTSTPRQSLNAFAPPFPLPPPTSIAPPAARAESATLPLPLPPPPSSLPAKPTSILPPVFVKRETAMLPQSMALPTVPPMGEGWEGDRSLSGNEKRRRASHAPSPNPSPGGSAGGSLTGSLGMGRLSLIDGRSGGSGGRPEKLVRLGERLKENIRPV